VTTASTTQTTRIRDLLREARELSALPHQARHGAAYEARLAAYLEAKELLVAELEGQRNGGEEDQ